MRWLKRYWRLITGSSSSSSYSRPSGIAYVVHLIRRILRSPLFALHLLFRGLKQGLASFAENTSWKRMAWGLPAAIAFVGTMYIAFGLDDAVDQAELQAAYRSAATDAAAAEDYSKAILLFDRLGQLVPEDNEVLMRLAAALADSGDEARARLILTELAPINRPGYSPAQTEVAKGYLREFYNRNGQDERLLARAMVHLKQAVAANPDNPVANSLLGQLYFQSGDYDEAIRYLRVAKELDGDAALRLAEAYVQSGDSNAARVLGEELIEVFGQRLESDQTNASNRIYLARALTFMRRFPEAAQVVKTGLDLLPESKSEKQAEDDQAMRTFLSNLFVLRARQMIARQESPERILSVYIGALRENPKNWEAFGDLMTLIDQGEEQRAKVREELNRLLTEGVDSPVVYLVLGSDSAFAGDLETADRLLNRALEMREDLGPALNNLAWSLAFKDEPEFERALQLADRLVEQAPGVGEYHDTRGQILVAMERYDEALDELLKALPTMQQNRQLHEALVRAYTELGFKEQAAAHQSRVDKLVREEEK